LAELGKIEKIDDLRREKGRFFPYQLFENSRNPVFIYTSNHL
jgi:hypothetical protein